jgi:multicomponent Na+:H+ antiporter subunit E
MNPFLLNVLLALAWAGVWGDLSVETLAVGFALGWGVLWLARPLLGTARYHGRAVRALAFAGFYLGEMALSGARVARQVLSPRLRMRPALVAVPLHAHTDAEIATFANLVSLTPGTLSVEVSPDRRVLYVHAMDLGHGGPDELRDSLKQGMERRVLALFR